MRVGIMQPYFFPYLAYYALICTVDVFVFYDDVQYIRRGWINRNRILNRDKAEMWEYMTVPVKKTSRETKIMDIDIFDEPGWGDRLKKTLTWRYSKSPYFNDLKEFLFDIIDAGANGKLSEFNIFSIRKVCNFLDIDTSFVQSSMLDYERELDGQGKLIDITRRLGGDLYINPIGGRELYPAQEFMRSGLKILFLNMEIIQYDQVKGDFIPDLSIIDVLMWNSKEDVKGMLSRYTLVEGKE